MNIEGNVAFDHFGHCYAVEDGVEVDNSFIGNIAIHTKVPSVVSTGLDGTPVSDATPGSFWLANANNIL